MRGSFVFKPPARIGLNAAQQKRADELRKLIAAYEDQLKDDNVHDADGIETQKEEAEAELNQILESEETEARGSTPVRRPPQRRLFQEEGVRPSPGRRRAATSENLPLPKEGPQPAPVLEKPPAKRARPEARLIEEWRAELNHIVSRALAPLMRTLGTVAARLRYDDVRPLLRWKQDGPLVEDRLELIEGADTVEAFVSKNSPVVGAQLLRLYISSYKESPKKESPEGGAPMGDPLCFDLDMDDPAAVDSFVASRAAARALNRLRLSDAENQFAPAWAFEVMGSGVFRAVLSATCLGAFEAAAAQVRRIPNCASFTMKELICSPSVSDQFAFLVSSVYLLSGDDGASNKGSRYSRNSTYLNIVRMRDQLGVSVYTCKIWFESVYARENPLIAHFNTKMKAQVSPVDEWTADQLVAYKVGQIEKARETTQFKNPSDIARLIEFAQFLGGGWLGEAQRFQQEYNQRSDKDVLFRAVLNDYKNRFRAHLNSPDNLRDRKENVKLEMLERLLEYRRMLPRRELLYMG